MPPRKKRRGASVNAPARRSQRTIASGIVDDEVDLKENNSTPETPPKRKTRSQGNKKHPDSSDQGDHNGASSQEPLTAVESSPRSLRRGRSSRVNTNPSPDDSQTTAANQQCNTIKSSEKSTPADQPSKARQTRSHASKRSTVEPVADVSDEKSSDVNAAATRKRSNVVLETNAVESKRPVKRIRSLSTQIGCNDGDETCNDLPLGGKVESYPDSVDVKVVPDDPLLDRLWVGSSAQENGGDVSSPFTVMSYNILADCHFRLHQPALFSDNPRQARHQRLLQEVEKWRPDILCLQEVEPEYFSDMLTPALAKWKYKGDMVRREHHNEGSAIFYNEDNFHCISTCKSLFNSRFEKLIESTQLSTEKKEAIRRYMDRGSVVEINRLQHKTSGRQLCVGSVHLTWTEHEALDLQAAEVAAAVTAMISEACGDPLLLCGDFNAWPGSVVYQLTRDGYLTHESITQLQRLKAVSTVDSQERDALVNILWPAFQHTTGCLRSAYREVQGCEPCVTSVDVDFVECLDYIWFSHPSLNPIDVLKTPPSSLLQKNLPNKCFPSDHVSLVAKISFT